MSHFDEAWLERRTGKKSKVPSKSEYEEQCEVIAWRDNKIVRLLHPNIGLLHAVPNGGVRISMIKGLEAKISRAIAGKKLKKEGVLSGVLDLDLPVARGGYFGLKIEMKKKGNTVTENQLNYIKAVEEEGYLCFVCYSSEEAIDLIVRYMNKERTKVSIK